MKKIFTSIILKKEVVGYAEQLITATPKKMFILFIWDTRTAGTLDFAVIIILLKNLLLKTI